MELQDSLIQAREALREQAMHDPLTHLLNRRATVDFLLSELSRADREQNSLSVMMVDIDLFKSVNDRFGHLPGMKSCAKWPGGYGHPRAPMTLSGALVERSFSSWRRAAARRGV